MAKNDKIDRIVNALNQCDNIGNSAKGILLMSWVLLLKFVDCYEPMQTAESESGNNYRTVLKEPFRWTDWACPKHENGKPNVSRQKKGEELVQFINNELLPHIRNIGSNAGSNIEMKPGSIEYILKHAFATVDNCVVDGKTFRSLLDLVDQVDFNNKSQLDGLAESYEKQILLAMKITRDAGKYYSSRPMIRAIVSAVKPISEESIYDPAVGTCGFLLEAMNFMKSGPDSGATDRTSITDTVIYQGADHTYFAFLMGTVNMILHGIEFPNYVIKNVPSMDVRNIQDDQRYDIVFCDIPYGEKAKPPDVVKNFPIEHENVDVLYLQHIMASLKEGGRAAIVVPVGMLERAEKEYKLVRKELLENFNVHTVLSLPSGVFLPYSYLKPCVLFFDRNGRTSNIWFYEFHRERDYFRSNSLADSDLEEFVKLFPKRETTKNSWMVPFDDVKVNFNLVVNNPYRPSDQVNSANKYLKELKPTELELKSQLLLKEINDMYVSYLDIRFEKIKNRVIVTDIVNVIQGEGLPKGGKFSTVKTEYPYLRNTSLTSKGTFDQSRLDYLSKETYENLKDHSISEIDLYVSATDSIGKTGIVPPELNGAIFSDDGFKFEIRDKNALDLKYLHLFSLTSDFMKQMKLSTTFLSNGQHLLLNELKKLEIPVSPIEEQFELVNLAWPIKEKIDIASDLLNGQMSNETEEVIEELPFLSELKQLIRELLVKETSKKLVSPFSTGGGGVHFESQVQAFFVTLMLTGGRLACLPNGTIQEIKLQGKVNGYNTDDLIVFIEDKAANQKFKMLGQIKHSIEFRKDKKNLEDVLRSFWLDYNTPEIFTKGSDVFTLITGPLNTSDRKPVQWLLERAKHTKESDEFFQDLEKSNFSPPKSVQKLEVIKSSLAKANGGCKVSDKDTYEFLKCFQLEELDFESNTSPIISLIYSLMSQFPISDTRGKWARIVKTVQSFNQNGGTITRENLPSDILDAFRDREKLQQPREFSEENKKGMSDWSEHSESGRLALLLLFGKWDSTNNFDKAAIKEMLSIREYEDWELIAKKILIEPETVLSHRNSIWTIFPKLELLKQLGSMILDKDLRKFFDLAGKILNEPGPLLESKAKSLHNGFYEDVRLKYSIDLRQGISEGLALIGNHSEQIEDWDSYKVKFHVAETVCNSLKDANWKQWAALSGILKNLAEAAPKEFLNWMKESLQQESNFITKIFSHENLSATGNDLVLGLRRSLEVLAWDEKFFEMACLCLGKLEECYPVKFSAGRPFDSLLKILLPWLPQTKADVKNRIDAIQAIREENNDLCWKLLLRLLPERERESTGTDKPKWISSRSGQWKQNVTKEDYWMQTNSCIKMAMEEVCSDFSRLIELLENLKYIPASSIDMIVKILSSKHCRNLSESDKKEVWDILTQFCMNNRRYQDAEWSLPIEMIEALEAVTKNFAPEKTFVRYQYLFDVHAYRFIEDVGTWEEQDEMLENKRNSAVKVLYSEYGMDGIVNFANAVNAPGMVGLSLACLDDNGIDEKLLPDLLDSGDVRTSKFIEAYVNRRQKKNGWQWVDEISISSWTKGQKSEFLTSLPFDDKTWNRAHQWLGENEFEYWKKASVCKNESSNYEKAVEKFIQVGRSEAAVQCLYNSIAAEKKVDSKLAVRALLLNFDTNRMEEDSIDYKILEIIEQLHQNSDICEDKLLLVESAHLSRFFRQSGFRPVLVEKKMATDPEYFTNIVQLAFQSSKSNGHWQYDSTESSIELAYNAYNLLNNWRTPPGVKNGKINSSEFKKWFERVEEICKESGHLDMAMVHIGIAMAIILKPEDKVILDETIAGILDERNNGDMRNGFKMGILDTRSIHGGRNGTYDRELAEYYKVSAKKFKKDYSRFALTLEEISEGFDFHVHQNIAQQKQTEKKRRINQI